MIFSGGPVVAKLFAGLTKKKEKAIADLEKQREREREREREQTKKLKKRRTARSLRKTFHHEDYLYVLLHRYIPTIWCILCERRDK